MDKELLKAAYSPEDFRENGHQLVDILADHLNKTRNKTSSKVINWEIPSEQYKFWNNFLLNGKPSDLNNEILKRSIHLHHPHYMGHQISPVAPVTGLTSLLNAILNNGMGIYEMGMAPTAMERVVVEQLCKEIGYDKKSDGFLTSGGTLANLTALLSARNKRAGNDVWENGMSNKLAIMVSEEAHYCIDRAVRIMGLGEKGIVKIPVGENFALNTALLEESYNKTIQEGYEIIAIVGSAPSTATGIYEDLDAIGDFALEKGIWFHIDAAHGGGAIYSSKYKTLLKGMKKADSIVIDGHKMMMMPSITTALLFKEGQDSHNTFRQKADYLLQESQEEDWYNLAKRTFECTKYMMSLHWYTLLKIYGKELFDEFVTTLYDLGQKFGEILEKDPFFEIAVKPMSNIICFRFMNKDKDLHSLNMINAKVRQKLLEEGNFYIVQTKIKGIIYLRATIMNPFTNEKHFKELLENIKRKAILLLNV
ncbi:pyridoxal-dependent decarboxylase [uncultured Eudoraea sp.]|uniref:pyridoxal phosphate-dependent decarboxylase family protein n=1 Tax=uncultured Eudoraea sp. TaxID=1035614 RepID=UPI0026176410|nr:pyridoxal-dependent decarboxylase [uncultured Eudoraea sp.]